MKEVRLRQSLVKGFHNIGSKIGLLYCVILFLTINHSCNPVDKEITYAAHIAPIIEQNCIACHQRGGAAPFPLEEYHQVFRKRNTILKVTQSGYMPPWPADRHYSNFVGERFLTEKEKNLIKSWVKSGGNSGDSSLLNNTRKIQDISFLGKPDVTLYFDSFYIEGDARDRFLVMTLPIELDRKSHVKAIEFVPGPNYLVHHMNGHLLLYDSWKKQNIFMGKRIVDVELPEDEYDRQFDSLSLLHDDGSKPARIHSATNYLPGAYPAFYPPGIGGFTLSKKSILVANDMHFGPISKGTWDQSKVNIFFTEHPPKRPIQETMMGTNGVSKIFPPLIIPPNQITNHISKLFIPENISILTINPHMHLLGESFKSYAIAPNGDTIKLIHIPKWNFRWQYFYTFKNMLKIPAGSTIVVEASFDNTDQNPNNPYNPPRQIAERLERGGAGMRTTDEMLQFIIIWLPYQKGDEKISLKY